MSRTLRNRISIWLVMVRYDSAPKLLAKKLYYGLVSAGMNGDFITKSSIGLSGPRHILYGHRTQNGAKWLKQNVEELKDFEVEKGLGMGALPDRIILELW